MFDAARAGQMDIFQQALPAGLPVNMTNDKGDSLVWRNIFDYHTKLTPKDHACIISRSRALSQALTSTWC
jgi:hypothetical protein